MVEESFGFRTGPSATLMGLFRVDSQLQPCYNDYPILEMSALNPLGRAFLWPQQLNTPGSMQDNFVLELFWSRADNQFML